MLMCSKTHVTHSLNLDTEKLEELTHEMDRYHWNILGLRESAGSCHWMTDTMFISVEKRTDTSMEFVF